MKTNKETIPEMGILFSTFTEKGIGWVEMSAKQVKEYYNKGNIYLNKDNKSFHFIFKTNGLHYQTGSGIIPEIIEYITENQK